MGIRVVDEREKFQFGDINHDGFQFYIRRLPSPIRNKLTNRHTTIDRRGNEHIDVGPLADDMLDYIVLGWEPGSVIGYDDEIIKFDPDNYMKAVRALPENFKIRLLDQAGVENIGTPIKKDNVPGGKDAGDAEKN